MLMAYQGKSLLLGITLIFITACGGGNKETTQELPKPAEPIAFDYQAAIDNTISDTVPGVILLVEKPDFKFLGSAGLADIDEKIAMETYHVMLNGSAGKKLTALLTVLLAEEGLLNLDDTIDNWLSDELLAQVEHSNQMTIRQLLNHTAGIYNYLDERTSRDFFEYILGANPMPLLTDVSVLPFGLNHQAEFLPGEGFSYSNTGYALVGLILDDILGEHHSVAIRNRILNPFGLNSAFYNGVEKSLGNIISGYAWDYEGNILNAKPIYENIGLADAPLSSNVEDLAMLLKLIVGEDDRLSSYVKEQLIGEQYLVDGDVSLLLSEPALLDNNGLMYYGLGVAKEIINDKVVYHHNGLEPGYSTSNIYIPESETSITIFFNCGLSEQCRSETDKLQNTILFNEIN